jgi:hypothetical protein
MGKKPEGWDISAVLWEDACTSIDDPRQGVVPTLSFGVVAKDRQRRVVRVVHDLTAMHGGVAGALTAIPKVGMRVKVIFLARLPVPEEFRDYWSDSLEIN